MASITQDMSYRLSLINPISMLFLNLLPNTKLIDSIYIDG